MNKPDKVNLQKAIRSIRSLAWKANSSANDELDRVMSPTSENQDPRIDNLAIVEGAIESAFIHLITLTEALELSVLHNIVLNTFHEARRIGLGRVDQFEDISAWSIWASKIQSFADSLEATYGVDELDTNATNASLVSVIRNLQGAVTDKKCFKPPRNEQELHDRIEMVLRCFYIDLVRKPPLGKNITGFIPDSGIPSLSTLLEYKFLAKESQAPQIANQILADSRGYNSGNWSNILFVIYETRRFKTPHEWRSLLKESGVSETIQLILLHGEEAEEDSHNVQPIGRKKRSQ